jgi:hypothetical protein
VRNIKLEHILVPEGRPSNPHPVASRAKTPLPCPKNRASPASMTSCTQRKTASPTLHHCYPCCPSTIMAASLMNPTLTYGAQVWYTGIQQKHLLNWLQIAQNEGLCKMMGVFRTTPIEPLHNLTRVPPIPYLIKKLMHSYTLRLRDLPNSIKVCTILSSNQCQY